jgi:hypothetical protein
MVPSWQASPGQASSLSLPRFYLLSLPELIHGQLRHRLLKTKANAGVENWVPCPDLTAVLL